MNVFFDEEKLEKGVQLSHSLSQAIAACNISIIVWSANYASSKSYLAELSYIMVMGRKVSQQHTALPIFYHVDPSDVRNLGGSFRTSFEEHEPNRPLDEVKRWKAAFVDIGKLKGWHIDGGKSDRKDWESEVDKLKEYAQPKILQILKSSYEGLDELEKNIFLDIACFFNWEHKDTVETILSGYYKGVVSGINNLVDKCLLDVGYFGSISMHDMLEEMGKDVIHQESKDTGKRGRIWNPKDVNQVLRYNKVSVNCI
ncbi:hypothetical protein F3Y22_tig00110264pilonHSYRG00048 [Hibiscus syriacus]|uniref:TIR domain-containing protein n=1 Tax=Hibiscus syriacus TaxID=106335 RepID=A0A6A3B8C2_HIBSY|nr:hypothetical protein F3Y22_tig00110264pilonHSYRG00048 [Hibiscus syriacus]